MKIWIQPWILHANRMQTSYCSLKEKWSNSDLKLLLPFWFSILYRQQLFILQKVNNKYCNVRIRQISENREFESKQKYLLLLKVNSFVFFFFTQSVDVLNAVENEREIKHIHRCIVINLTEFIHLRIWKHWLKCANQIFHAVVWITWSATAWNDFIMENGCYQ